MASEPPRTKSIWKSLENDDIADMIDFLVTYRFKYHELVRELRDESGMNVLQVAVQYGRKHFVESLLKYKIFDANATSGEDKETPLHLAVSRHHRDLRILLIKNGANVNATNCEGQTPLHKAVAHNDKIAVLYLCRDRGVDLNITDNAGETAYYSAIKNLNLDIAAFLKRVGANTLLVPKSGITVREAFTKAIADQAKECLPDP